MAALATKMRCATRESITVSDIRTEDGNQVLIELSDGRIILLTVTEILRAIVAQAAN